MPSIICRRHHADDILAKKMKKNPPSPPFPIKIPLYLLMYCSEVWWRNYVWIPLHLGPSNFWFLCVPLLQLPAFHPNNCLQQMPRTIYYDTFLEWSVLCFFFLFSVLKQNGSCVTFLLECLQHIIVNTYSKWRWCSSTTQYTRTYLSKFFWIMQKDKNYYINQGMQSLADAVTHCQLPLVVYCKMTLC